MEEPAVAILGLPGFGLLEVREIDGELEYLVETRDTVAGCPKCGTIAKATARAAANSAASVSEDRCT